MDISKIDLITCGKLFFLVKDIIAVAITRTVLRIFSRDIDLLLFDSI